MIVFSSPCRNYCSAMHFSLRSVNVLYEYVDMNMEHAKWFTRHGTSVLICFT